MPTSLKERLEKKRSRPKKKHMVRRINQIAKQIVEMRKQCCVCSREFDPTEPGSLDTWHVTVNSDGVQLTCPTCAGSPGTVEKPPEEGDP